MEKTQKTKKPLILAAAAFVVLVAAGLVIWKFTAPQGTAGAKAYTFTVVDAEGKETVHELHTDEEMLGAALLNEGLIEGEDSEYGLFVKTVDGITANEDNQEWWSLTIDGEMAMTGVDSTPVEDGGKYEFTLTVGYCLRLRLTALSGVLGAVLLVVQVALAPLPNIELVSLLVVLFTLALGRYVAYALAVFVLLEGLLYGFGLWWFSYLYIWAVLAVLAHLFRRMESRLGWALLCGFYGLFFGTLTAVPVFFLSGAVTGLAYIVSGIPFDLTHAAGNFLLALLLLPPLRRLLPI